MRTARAAYLATFVLSSMTAACGFTHDYGARESGSYSLRETGTDGEALSTLGYGWDTEITKDAVDELLGSKRAATSHTLAGYSLSQIVTSPKVRIRKDNEACVTCHSWATWSDRESFCARVDDFLSMPTAKDDGKDPNSAKPAVLKTLLKNWKDEGCPE